MFLADKVRSGMNRKTAAILLIVLVVLLVGNVVQAMILFAPGKKNVENTLKARLSMDVSQAHTSATQISRTGGTTTQKLLGEIRQYLYGSAQVNELAVALLGSRKPIVQQELISAAVDAVDKCESALRGGQTMDVPLKTLMEALVALVGATEGLRQI